MHLQDSNKFTQRMLLISILFENVFRFGRQVASKIEAQERMTIFGRRWPSKNWEQGLCRPTLLSLIIMTPQLIPSSNLAYSAKKRLDLGGKVVCRSCDGKFVFVSAFELSGASCQVLGYHRRSLLADHHARRLGVPSDQFGHYGGVHDSQSFDTVNPEAAVDDGVLAPRTHSTC